MKLPFCEMLFLSYLYPANCFNIAKFHAQISTKLKKQRHWSWKVSKHFRDRKSRFIVLLVSFSAIACESQKVCRQVTHCKKGFCEIFQMVLTVRYVCIWDFWENLLFCFVSCLFGKVLDGFRFFASTILGLECFQGLYQVTHHCFRVGEKQCCGKKTKLGKKGSLKKEIF